MSAITLKTYAFPLLLILAVMGGGLFGIHFPSVVVYLKSLGEVFLNLLFTTIVPLIFFSVTSAIASAESMKSMGRIFFYMMWVFLITGLLAAVSALICLKCFPLTAGFVGHLPLAENKANPAVSNTLVAIFTASDFSKILSHQHILALIVFSILVGFAVLKAEDQGKKFLVFLKAGEEVFMRVFAFIMYSAPIGFFCYFAVLAKDIGSELIGNYAQVALRYYGFSILYFITMYSLYAYLARGKAGIAVFWKQIYLPMLTALATCSSAASIPANLTAAKKMNIPAAIYETGIPLGSMIHKDGSIIGGMMKIAFLFGMFHLSFTGTSTLLIAVLVSVLVGTVMGGIPSGGMLGELLILSVYGFPSSALMIIAAISIIIDPIATMLNVTGNTVSCMLIEKWTGTSKP